MSSLSNYPGTVSQTTGGSYRTFSNLANIKVNADNVWATSSGNIKGKSSSPNRPSAVTCTNFGFSLPEGAEVTRVRVYYRHKKTGSLNIPAPTITLQGVTGSGVNSAKGSAPTTSMVTHYQTWTTTNITRSMVNSGDFGVKLDYPANTNTSEGTVSISYVRIELTYEVPSYSVTLKKVSGGYNEEPYTIQASISNLRLTSYTPTLTINNPNGFEFDSMAGDGTYTLVDSNTITWNPQLTSKTSSSTSQFTFNTDVTYPAGQTSFTGDFTLTESLYSGSKTLSATIRDRPEGEGEEGDDDHTPVITDDNNILAPTSWEVMSAGTEILVDLDLSQFEQTSVPIFAFPCTDNGTPVLDEEDTPVKYSTDGTNWSKVTTYTNTKYTAYIPSRSNVNTLKFKGESVGRYVILLYDDPCSTGYYDEMSSYVPKIAYFFEIKPDKTSLSTPNFSVLEITGEELDRLGDGFTYIAQSDINHTTTDTNVRDWYKNNRIGICNRPQIRIADNGTTNNHNDIWATTNATLTRETDYSLLTETSATGYCLLKSDNKIAPSQTIEFDLLQTEGTTTLSPIYIRNDGGGSSLSNITYSDLGASLEEWVHCKIVFNNTSIITIYSDKLETAITKTLSATSTNYRLMFYCGGAITQLQFKNVKIYDTILSTGQIYDNAVWSKQTGGLNEYNNCECEFTYDEQYPLYVLMTGDYPEATSYGYDVGTVKYDTPCIVEKQVYNGRERNGTYPVPIEALLSGEDIATLELASNQTSQGAVLYSFLVDETVSTNDKLAIRGFQVRANIDYTDDLVVQAKLHSPTGEVGNRSILVNSNDEEIVIGGLGDLWGFTTLEMQHLELWQLELSIANILNNSNSTILLNNVEIIFYLETVEKQEITIKVEDEDIAYYGAFIETVSIPEGLHTDTSFLSIDGTDTNDAYRQNIREKTITIEFNLSNCDIKTSTDMLRQLTKLFVNEKDKYNRPIPKRIQFSHYPNDYFEYIMEEPFDVDTEITDYNIKASLTIPSGTSYSLYDTVTNTTGNANGLAAVNPIITFRPSDVNIQINEGNTDQTFNIAYTGDWYDHTVEIDCEDRKVYLILDEDTRIDISKYADYNSDWFRLDGEYDFSSVNCTILSVLFNERW